MGWPVVPVEPVIPSEKGFMSNFASFNPAKAGAPRAHGHDHIKIASKKNLTTAGKLVTKLCRLLKNAYGPLAQLGRAPDS